LRLGWGIEIGNDGATVWGPMDTVRITAHGYTLGSNEPFFFRMIWADFGYSSTNTIYTDAIDSTELLPDPRLFSNHCLDQSCSLMIGDTGPIGGFDRFSSLFVSKLPFVIPVSEPNSLALFCFGLAVLALKRSRRVS
jgi:hypothetical protein